MFSSTEEHIIHTGNTISKESQFVVHMKIFANTHTLTRYEFTSVAIETKW